MGSFPVLTFIVVVLGDVSLAQTNLVDSVDMLGVIIPPEKVFKDDAFVVREITYTDDIIFPEAVIVTLYSRSSDLYRTLDNTDANCQTKCSINECIYDIYYRYALGDGAQCGRDGMRFWYQITPSYGLTEKDIHVWSDVIIQGIVRKGQSAQTITYPLNPHGQVSVLTTYRAPIVYDSVQKKGTTICFRYSERGCYAPDCNNKQEDLTNYCGNNGHCYKTGSRYECKCDMGFYMNLGSKWLNCLAPLIAGKPRTVADIPPETVCKDGDYVTRTLFMYFSSIKSIEVLLFDTLGGTHIVLSRACNQTTISQPTGDLGGWCKSDTLFVWYKNKTGITYKRMAVYGLDRPIGYKLASTNLHNPPNLGKICRSYAQTSDCVRDPTALKLQCSPDTKCVVLKSGGLGCECAGNTPCMDIDECADETHNCDPQTQICKNIPGAFYCEHKRIPRPPTVHPRAVCRAGFVDITPGADNDTCVEKKAVTPQETVCKFRKHSIVVRFVSPLNYYPGEPGTLGGKNLSSSMKFYSGKLVSFESKCEATPINLLNSVLVSPPAIHTISPVVDAPRGLDLDIALYVGDNRYGMMCFSNMIMMWWTQDEWVEMAYGNLDGAVAEGLDDFMFVYAHNDRRVPSDEDKCNRVGTSDACHWIKQTPPVRCDNHNSFCEFTSSPPSFGCSCKPGYNSTAGQCVSNTLCFDGLELVDGVCEDVDECVTSPCTAGLTCINSYGGYGCSKQCPGGYILNNSTNECEDIDECARGNHGCDANSTACRNLEGGFRCDCLDLKNTHHNADGNKCVPLEHHFRLLDPDHVRCCGHTPDNTAFLVKATVNPVEGSGQDYYKSINPVGCLHVSSKEVTRVRGSTTKPYLVAGGAEFEEESLLDFVHYDNKKFNEKFPNTPVNMKPVLQYDSGCSQTFSADGNTNGTDLPVYIALTPATSDFYNPKKTLSRRCVPLSTNPIALNKLLLEPKPKSMPKVDCRTNGAVINDIMRQLLAIAAVITRLFSEGQ